MNHGSYGAVPRVVFDAEVDWMKQMESNTFYWFLPVMGYRLPLAEVRQKVADYVGADATDIVMVENASSGVNAVLRSLMPYYTAGTKILRLSLAYPMVQHTMSYIAEMAKLEVIDVVIDLPTDETKALYLSLFFLINLRSLLQYKRRMPSMPREPLLSLCFATLSACLPLFFLLKK